MLVFIHDDLAVHFHPKAKTGGDILKNLETNLKQCFVALDGGEA
jgi:hypothetical protein